MRYLFFIVCIGCFAPFLKGQEVDTVYLDDITVSVPAFQRFSAGSNFKNIAIEPYKSQLEDVLAGEGSVYFKTYGNRQLSTISFRGTSSSQTNVLWHGIPANYPTLGQLDFSQWPVWMIESIGIQPGSAGALYGSGSIGGTILLDSEIDPGKDGNRVDLRMEAGSFGYLFTGIKAGYKSGKWSGRTSLFRSYIENDFSYDLNGKEVRQKNASVLDYGFQQQAVYRAGDHKISFDGMITQNDREIQPSKFSPDREDRLKTENIRLALEHTWETDKSSLTNTLAYLQNDQLYNESDRTKSDQYSFLTSYWLEWNDRISFRTGLNINKFTAAS
ncbi:MAG: TonB-dependent receptor plug domain-containing protein, partial [Bacteroidetes bacterium]|nr:TonB-dependent receptor plug domain-containing protein [Bacteroidota bacterium]